MKFYVIPDLDEAVDPVQRGRRVKKLYKAWHRLTRVHGHSWATKGATRRDKAAQAVLGHVGKVNPRGGLGSHWRGSRQGSTGIRPSPHIDLHNRHHPSAGQNDYANARSYRVSALKTGKHVRMLDKRKSLRKHYKHLARISLKMAMNHSRKPKLP